MTEEDTESIWSATLETARFALIGIRLAEFINFKLYADATNQCTDTGVTPLLEQFSEEVLIQLIAAAKETVVTEPWTFIQSNVMSFLIKHFRLWKETFLEIKKALGRNKSIEIVTVEL